MKTKEIQDYYRLVTKTFRAGSSKNPKHVTGEQYCKGFEFIPKISCKHQPKPGMKVWLRIGHTSFARHITTA